MNVRDFRTSAELKVRFNARCQKIHQSKTKILLDSLRRLRSGASFKVSLFLAWERFKIRFCPFGSFTSLSPLWFGIGRFLGILSNEVSETCIENRYQNVDTEKEIMTKRVADIES